MLTPFGYIPAFVILVLLIWAGRALIAGSNSFQRWRWEQQQKKQQEQQNS
jgi:hypothetical protein